MSPAEVVAKFESRYSRIVDGVVGPRCKTGEPYVVCYVSCGDAGWNCERRLAEEWLEEAEQLAGDRKGTLHWRERPVFAHIGRTIHAYSRFVIVEDVAGAPAGTA